MVTKAYRNSATVVPLPTQYDFPFLQINIFTMMSRGAPSL